MIYIFRQHSSIVIVFGAMLLALGIAALGVPSSPAAAANLPTAGDAEARFAELSRAYNQAIGEHFLAVRNADRAAFQATRNRLLKLFKEGRQVLLQLESEAPNALARCQEYSGNFFDALTSIREEARAAMSKGLEKAADEFYRRAIFKAMQEAGKEAEALSEMRRALSGAALEEMSDDAMARLAGDMLDDAPGASGGAGARQEFSSTAKALTSDEVNDFLDTPKGQKFTEDFERDLAEAARLRKELEKSAAFQRAQALKEAEELAKREAAARARKFLGSDPGTRANVAKSCPSGTCASPGLTPKQLEEIRNLAYQDKLNAATNKIRQEAAVEAEYGRVVADVDEKVGRDFARMVKDDQKMRQLLNELAKKRNPPQGVSRGAIAAAAVLELVARAAEANILNTNLDAAQLAFAQEMEFTTNWLRSANNVRAKIFGLLGQPCQKVNFGALQTLWSQYNDLLGRAEGTTLKAMMWGGIVAQLTTGKIGLKQLDPTGIVSLFEILFNQTGELKEAPSVQVYGPLIAYADLTSLFDQFSLLKAVMANALQKKSEQCITACAPSACTPGDVRCADTLQPATCRQFPANPDAPVGTPAFTGAPTWYYPDGPHPSGYCRIQGREGPEYKPAAWADDFWKNLPSYPLFIPPRAGAPAGM